MRGLAVVSFTSFLLTLAACSDQSDTSPTDAVSDPDLRPATSPALAPGQVETILDLRPLTDMPEGIAVDQQGNIFVGNRRLQGDVRVSEILKIAPDNTVSVFATLDPGTRDDLASGVLGLALDSQGDLYAALPSFNPGTHGVWRIRRGGGAERLAGSDQMQTPNALAFDAQGNFYVTDSQDGTIWRFPPAGSGRLWLRHQLLAPEPDFGANGIAFVPPRTLFVANTDQALIARIPIEPNGDPGEPSVAASGFELLTIDGLAADAQGDLHAVIAAGEFIGTASLVQVNPATGAITPSTEVDRFDFPTSLAFGTGPRDRKSVYIINAGLFAEGRPEAAPGVVRVGLEVPGFPIH